MNCQSCLGDPSALIVIDASVAINLNASGFNFEILKAVPNKCLVVEEVVFELEHGKNNGHRDGAALLSLVSGGEIEIVRLGDAGIERFTDLVSGSSAETLDDGEAATIAYALEQGAVAIIDERKANRIRANRFPELKVGCTVDLLAHEMVQAALGHEPLAEAVFNALYVGRMRVLADHMGWVVDLIGPDRAGKCISLPKSVRLSNTSPAQRRLISSKV